MDIDGPDGQLFCFTYGAKCSNFVPPTPTGFIPPKPANVTMAPRSGKTMNVLHLSDYHLDLRYAVGSEANCTQCESLRPALSRHLHLILRLIYLRRVNLRRRLLP